TAGLDTTGTDGPKPGVNVVVRMTDGTYTVVILRVTPASYLPHVTLPFDLTSTVGIVATFAGTTATPVALVGKGSLSFVDAGMTAGARVSGSFSADLFAWPF
ncbi:MAG TPA: hypothetical protein VHU40_22045, partial [Polyangia bacterium]|nr:hypothetical protein [Polyangia bacterium]